MIDGGLRITAGNTIRMIRMYSGLNQKAAASMLGISVAALSKLESGKDNPTLDRVERIAEKLGYRIQFVVVPIAD